MPYAILGGDALKHDQLVPDLKRRLLIDVETLIEDPCCEKSITELKIYLVDPAQTYASLLAQFPTVTRVEQVAEIQERGVYHFLKTTGPPVAQRARMLCPEKLQVAKNEFKQLCKAGICRPSNSP